MPVTLGPKIWCWDDLWRAVLEASAEGPAVLSAAGVRAALDEAIARARRDGVLQSIADVVAWRGFRRRLHARFAGWTRSERPLRTAPAGDDLTRDQWLLFGRYRAVLNELGAEDPPGFAVWASKALAERRPPGLDAIDEVYLLNFTEPTRAESRTLEAWLVTDASVTVTLPFDEAPLLGEVYSPVAPTRQHLLKWGFDETRFSNDDQVKRPAVLRALEQALFRDDVHECDPIEQHDGLRVVGAPRSEGIGLVVARDVKRLLDEGHDAESILVLFPHWDSAADVVLETLRAWHIPAAAETERPLAREPELAALGLAMSLPANHWETARLVQLLRHGRVRFGDESEGRQSLAVAASAIRSTRVFRGLEPLRKALDRASMAKDETKARRARESRETLEGVLARLEPMDQERPWHAQVRALHTLAQAIGITAAPSRALDQLWLSLDDHGAVLDGLQQGDRPWLWADFVREVEGLIREITLPAPAAQAGTVRLATVDAVDDARADFVFLVNLEEGTFPDRAVVDADLPARDDGPQASPAFARAMLQFLSVIGSADQRLTLVYPTADAKGQPLLRAGFLDDLLRLFPEKVLGKFHEMQQRFDPALLDRPDLAGAPADARVRAVALACVRDDRTELDRLANDPRHAAALAGTAAALHVGAARLEQNPFGIYDGRLSDPAAIARVAHRFGPDYVFSPSQLETYISCPFKFALQYMLKLEPIDERDEFEDDYSERGSRIHALLETLEQRRLQTPQDRVALAEALIRSEGLYSELVAGSDIDHGLIEIEQRRLSQLVRRYARQHAKYEQLGDAGSATPHRFEVVFGLEQTHADSKPSLIIGDEQDAVKLQGKIDRIDLLESGASTKFRVIDYKSGSCPTKKDVQSAAYVQLPLYAMAVERLILEIPGLVLEDVGYWELKKTGFRPIRLARWEDDQAPLADYILKLVKLLRQGVFVVDSRQENCTQYCEFSRVCRVRQARTAGKTRDDAPSLELTV